MAPRVGELEPKVQRARITLLVRLPRVESDVEHSLEVNAGEEVRAIGRRWADWDARERLVAKRLEFWMWDTDVSKWRPMARKEAAKNGGVYAVKVAG